MSEQLTPRAHGQGNALPWWLNTKDPEAIRGTQRVRSIDPNLIVGRNRKTQRFEVWGPSLFWRGWVPISECLNDQGEPWYANVPWERVVASLIEARDGMSSADRAHQANEKLRQEKEAAFDREVSEGLRFWRKHVAGQVSGSGRHSDRDVTDAWNKAKDGSKPGPRGQIISVPKPADHAETPVKIEVARG